MKDRCVRWAIMPLLMLVMVPLRGEVYSQDVERAVEGEGVRTCEGHRNGIAGLDFSPDGKVLASAGKDSSIHLWNVKAGKLERTLADHTGPVFDVAFTSDGKLLASCRSR